MKIFLDTSSLLKLYHNEIGSKEIVELFEQQNIEEVYLSDLAKIEFKSAVFKKVRTMDLNIEEANSLIKLFELDYSKYTFIACNAEIVERSCMLLVKYGVEGLRSLDSIQLASILKFQISIAISADDKLNKFIAAEGVKTDF